ncbi:hypothetical protein [Streptomyces sp. NPDC029674]|uniref:hypothetical protein n=1 Tax=Streptomyces sp. NPDC029674 TaxID=3365297 RepID=UPI00384AB4E9
MGNTKRELEHQYGELQKRLQNHYARLEDLSAGDDGFAAQYQELVTSGNKLLEFERTLPARLAEPDRQLSERIVHWSWRGQGVLALTLIVLVFVLDHSGWWLLLLLPHLMAVLAGSFQTVAVVDHLRRRKVCIGVHLAGVLVALISLSVISTWFLVLLVLVWIVTAVALSEGPSSSGKGRQT